MLPCPPPPLGRSGHASGGVGCAARYWAVLRPRGDPRNFQRFETAWDELEVTAEQFIDAGERVFVTAHFRGRRRASGIPVDARLYEVYTLSDAKIVRIDEFTDRNAAFQAAGLSQ